MSMRRAALLDLVAIPVVYVAGLFFMGRCLYLLVRWDLAGAGWSAAAWMLACLFAVLLWVRWMTREAIARQSLGLR